MRPGIFKSAGAPSKPPVRFLPGHVERDLRVFVRGHVPGGHAFEFLQPVIGAGGETHDLDMLEQQSDERQEQRAIEALVIKVLRGDIRGGDQDHALLEQAGEQTPEDHGVGDVGDMEFVEAQ